MISALASTQEICNMDLAANSLAAEITSQIGLLGNSIGFLYCDSCMDYKRLSENLNLLLGFDIIGCTAIGTLDNKKGFGEIGASLLVISSDKENFSIKISDNLNPDNCSQICLDTYRDLIESLEGKTAKLTFVLANAIENISIESAVKKMSEVYENMPIFGGFPSGYELDKKEIFLNGSLYDKNMLICIVTGDIQPVFSITNVNKRLLNRNLTVTKAEGKTIYEVNYRKVLDVLKDFGIHFESSDKEELLLFFHANPLLIDHNVYNETIQDVKVIENYNTEEGSIVTYSPISVGATFSISSLRACNMHTSVNDLTADIKTKIKANEEKGYKYSTMLCASCFGRYISLVSDRNIEGRIIAEEMPKDVNVLGFYSYGEIAPVVFNNGIVLNGVYNCSIIFCAI